MNAHSSNCSSSFAGAICHRPSLHVCETGVLVWDRLTCHAGPLQKRLAYMVNRSLKGNHAEAPSAAAASDGTAAVVVDAIAPVVPGADRA